MSIEKRPDSDHQPPQGDPGEFVEKVRQWLDDDKDGLLEAKELLKEACGHIKSLIAEKWAKKVKYEWDMFTWTVDRCLKNWNDLRKPEQNMVLEDMLLHARVLRDFFTMPKPQGEKEDDITAEHFVEDPDSWRKQAPSLCPYLEQNRKRLNKKLTHLTTARLTLDERWKPQVISRELKVAWEKFLSSVPETSQAWFTGTLE